MSPPVTRIEVPVDTRAPGGTTNAYLADGLLVDPAARTETLDAAVGVAGAETDVGSGAPSPVDAIAVTHAHPDHVGGVAAYADLTDARVFAHAAHADRFADATGIEPDDTFRGGDAVGGTAGNTAVRAVATPGHAPDHVAFAVGDALLCGDLAVAEGSVVVGGPGADLRAYLDSLTQVRDAGYGRLLPGHGPPILDPDATCQRLIDHRLDRERAVLDAVENGAADVDAVVDAAYEKDLAGVEDLARATVVAHLEKLLAVGEIGATWRDRLYD
ncbi:beta-lactamase [Halorubrum aidingense JCM 13560]|uniref:Beta-lactamase n=1 Tax=Halorubrum aidingense JCM 13560 TaxID=1230454 RepID=M0PI15_9EURY|nr:MBL fold metallo-hydrolase [Halorubrum aidingense]EMA69721.1 beta-lactamase [Halorubrum aidingense JCM 13560]